jgi:hypothetical protein
MDYQRARQRESVRDALKSASVPVPQSIVNELALLRREDALDVLTVHPGFTIWRRWNSYKAARSIFDSAFADLFDAIDELAELMRHTDVFRVENRHMLAEGKQRIRKELFAASNAAHSLKDHATYRLQDVAAIHGFRAKLTEHFGQDGLHDFVIALRTITHHIDVLEPEWKMTHRFGEAEEITFQLDRNELQAVIESAKAESGKYKINKAGRAYLDDAPDEINIRNIYRQYFERANAFHDWFTYQLEKEPPSELEDLQCCLKANSDNAARTWWKALLVNWLRNWETPPNPYSHLSRYLTEAQIKEVYQLPPKSKQQVDKVIEFIDVDNACDEEIRELAYEMFARAPD